MRWSCICGHVPGVMVCWPCCALRRPPTFMGLLLRMPWNQTTITGLDWVGSSAAFPCLATSIFSSVAPSCSRNCHGSVDVVLQTFHSTGQVHAVDFICSYMCVGSYLSQISIHKTMYDLSLHCAVRFHVVCQLLGFPIFDSILRYRSYICLPTSMCWCVEF